MGGLPNGRRHIVKTWVPTTLGVGCRLDSEGQEEVTNHMGLVYKVAHRMRERHTNSLMDFDDLVSEGTFGLIHALERYDPALGATFGTYATHCIVGRIREAHRKNFREYRQAKLRGLIPPTTVSLDAPINDDGLTLGDLLAGKAVTELEIVEHMDLVKFWKGVMQRLHPAPKRALRLMLRGLSQKEAAEALGVTGAAVCHNYHRGLEVAKKYRSALERKERRHERG
jgi:RNA polymerase sigma factor (sigma-70 family)